MCRLLAPSLGCIVTKVQQVTTLWSSSWLPHFFCENSTTFLSVSRWPYLFCKHMTTFLSMDRLPHFFQDKHNAKMNGEHPVNVNVSVYVKNGSDTFFIKFCILAGWGTLKLFCSLCDIERFSNFNLEPKTYQFWQ